MDLHAHAVLISDNLTRIDLKNDETRIVWTDNAPEKYRKWFQDVTGEFTGFSFSQLDECYRVLDTLCDIIIDQKSAADEDEVIDVDELDDLIYEHEWCDIYNADLLEWVKEDLTRGEDVNDAIREGSEDIFQAIQQAQETSRANMAHSFLHSMAKIDQEEK